MDEQVQAKRGEDYGAGRGAGVRNKSDTADGGLLELRDVPLHPVQSEVGLLDQRLEVRDEPQIA